MNTTIFIILSILYRYGHKLLNTSAEQIRPISSAEQAPRGCNIDHIRNTRHTLFVKRYAYTHRLSV